MVSAAPLTSMLPCEEPGCTQKTREGKPYCGDHLQRLPYAAALMAQVDELDGADLARRPEDVALDGLAAEGVRQVLLERGEVTPWPAPVG